jgi:hypothetical protein
VLRWIMAHSWKVGRTGGEMESVMKTSLWLRRSCAIFRCVYIIN